MGLPEILIQFKTKAVSAIQRSQKGIVALIIQDTAETGVKEYKGLEEVGKDVYSEVNYDYISLVFRGTPNKVVVVNVGESGTVSDGLNVVKNTKFNYLSVPFATTLDNTEISTFIKSQRDNNKKTFKAVLSNELADHEGIVNFTTTDIVVGGKTYTPAEYTARIAGVLAGLPFTRSATYYVLNEVDSITEHEDPDADIENGELILVNDGEKVKIGRGVNSLTTFTPEKSEQFSKIKIVDGMDLVKDDIRSTFNDGYVGKVINNYDNKLLFLGAVNAYFKGLANDSVLDINAENVAGIDFAAQKLYLQSIGVNVDDLTVQKLLEYNTGSKVFAGANIRFVDAMEDLYFDISA